MIDIDNGKTRRRIAGRHFKGGLGEVIVALQHPRKTRHRDGDQPDHDQQQGIVMFLQFDDLRIFQNISLQAAKADGRNARNQKTVGIRNIFRIERQNDQRQQLYDTDHYQKDGEVEKDETVVILLFHCFFLWKTEMI